MKFIEAKVREKYTILNLQTNDGERVDITLLHEKETLIFNTGFGNPYIKSRTGNEFEVHVTEENL